MNKVVERLFGSLVVPLVFGALMLALPLMVLAQTDADVAGGLFAGGFSLLCCGLWFVINIIILVWVYRDAEARQANGLLWALIVFFAGIVGLLLYFAVGRNRTV